MSDIITGFHFDTGTRELYEDRVTAQNITRANGDHLAVAIVADGVGGENRGERAAQIAIDAVSQYLQSGTESLVADLLTNAVFVANREVFGATRSERGTSCTLSIAVIHNNQTLYVANVGDSRVYLLRNTNLTQLTMDHVFKNVIPLQGKMSHQSAANSPRSEVLMWAVGINAETPVDIGFHIDETVDEQSYLVAQARGKKGLPLQKGDSILVCSDGLIKDSPADGTPLIREEEIVQILTTQEGNRAARGLVSFALGRDADDNVSAAILQTADPERSAKVENEARKIRLRSGLFYGSIIAMLLVISFVAISFFRNRSAEQAVQLEEEQARVEVANAEVSTADARAAILVATADQATVDAQNFSIATQTVAAILQATQDALPTATPIPTSTPRPTLQPGQIGFYRNQNQPDAIPLYEDELVTANERAEVQINHEGIDDEDASIYAQQGSELEFNRVSRLIELSIFPESDIVLQSGLYQSGAEIEVRTQDDDVVFGVSGSCMAVDFSEAEQSLTSYCFEGICQYEIGRNEPVEIPTGQQLLLNPADLSIDPVFSPISQRAAVAYQRLLLSFPSGAKDVRSCLLPYLPPPPTPTPTATIFVPSPTPEVPTEQPSGNSGSSGSDGGTQGGNNDPVPPAEAPATPEPAAPVPTNTSPPPAATPTPVATPIPLTSTPIPIEEPTATEAPVEPPTPTEEPVEPPPPTEEPVEPPPPTEEPVEPPPPTEEPVEPPPPTEEPVEPPPPTEEPVEPPPPTEEPVEPPPPTEEPEEPPPPTEEPVEPPPPTEEPVEPPPPTEEPVEPPPPTEEPVEPPPPTEVPVEPPPPTEEPVDPPPTEESVDPPPPTEEPEDDPAPPVEEPLPTQDPGDDDSQD